MSIIVSPGVVLGFSPTSLSLPRLLYDDVFMDGTITATTEDTDAEALNVADGLTWDYWRPTALPARIEVQLTEVREVDYMMVAAHDLGTNEVSVRPQYHDGSGWVDAAAEYRPGSDDVMAMLFERVESTRFAVYLDGETSPEALPSLGVVMMGRALVVQRGQPLSHRPARWSKQTEVRPLVSEGGLYLGRSIRREGVSLNVRFQHLEADWVRRNLDPFIDHARTRPFGWLWHPQDYPPEAALLWTEEGDIQPEHAGLPNRVNVSFKARGVTR